MSQIGALSGVNGATTTITLNYVPAFVLLGTVDLDMVLTDFSVTIGGKVRQQVTGQSTIQAICKYLMECLLGADVKIGMLMKLADGFIPDQTLELRLTQTGTTTPTVYGYSENKGQGFPVVAGQQTLQASSNLDFAGFTALFFPTTNFDYAQVSFADGHSDKFSAAELASLFSFKNQADADGYLAGQVVIDNKDFSIANVTLFSTSGGTLQVSSINLLGQ